MAEKTDDALMAPNEADTDVETESDAVAPHAEEPVPEITTSEPATSEPEALEPETLDELRERSIRNHLGWIGGAVAGLVIVALAVVLIVQLARPHKYQVPARDQAAMSAAAQVAANIGTYSRKNLDSDYQRAMNGLSGTALSQMQGNEPKLQSTLTSLKADLVADVTSVSLEQDATSGVAVLVAFNGYKVTDDGTKTLQSANRIELTMKQSNGKWLADNITSLGIDE